jgi:hypothetical protein
VMGWIAACVLVALLLPLVGMMLLDNLTIANRAEKALEKIEKIERQIEKERREKNRKKPDSYDGNLVFDRVRRSIPLPVPRPNKLGKTRM